MATTPDQLVGGGANEVMRCFPIGKRVILMGHEFYVAENTRTIQSPSLITLRMPHLLLRYMDSNGVFHTLEPTGQEIAHLLRKAAGDAA